MVDVYLSGIEGALEEFETMFKNGYKLTHLMTAFPSFRKSDKFIADLKRLKETYGFKLIVDSGAYGFVFGKEVEEKTTHTGWHDVASFVKEFKGRENDYFEEYFKWLTENRDVYDYAVELDIQGIVGQEQVDKWREKLISSNLPIIYVLHLQNGDTVETAKKLQQKGATYVGIGEVKLDINKSILVARQLKKLGLKVHFFGYTPKDLFKYRSAVDTVDSSTWLGGSKLANLFYVRGKTLEEYKITQDKMQVMNVLRDRFFDIFDRKKVEEEIKKNKYWYLNFWNALQFQKWAEANNGTQQAYKKDLQLAEEGKLVLPEWANTFDKNGMLKVKYLRSRFNNWKSGSYAKAIQSMTVLCDQCPVGGLSASGQPLCPKYEAGGVCWFTPLWSKLGKNTRNKEQILHTLEDVVASAYVRYQRALWVEQLTGVVDRTVTQLYKELVTSLELLNRAKFGVQNLSTINMLNIGDNKVQVNSIDEDALAEVRKLYGEGMVERIKKKLEQSEKDANDSHN